MKKILICVIAALLLTLPVYVGLAHIQPLEDWFMNGTGWKTFEPLFKLCNTVGIYGNARILTSTMLFFSFMVSVAVVFILFSLINRK